MNPFLNAGLYANNPGSIATSLMRIPHSLTCDEEFR